MFESTTPAARPHSRFLCVSAIAHATAVLLMVTIHFSSSIHFPPRPSLPTPRTSRYSLLICPSTSTCPGSRAHQPVPAPIPPPEPVPEPRHIAREFHAPAPRPATPAPVKLELAAIPAPELPRVTIPTVETPRIERVTTAVKTGTFASVATPHPYARRLCETRRLCRTRHSRSPRELYTPGPLRFVRWRILRQLNRRGIANLKRDDLARRLWRHDPRDQRGDQRRSHP